MSTVHLTARTFEQAVRDNEIVLVDYWAPWSRASRIFAPVFEEAARRHPDILFAKVDTDAQPSVMLNARITSIPTLVAHRAGVLVLSQVGAQRAAALEMLVEELRAGPRVNEPQSSSRQDAR